MKPILFSFFLLFTFLFSPTIQAQKQREHYQLLWKISGNGLKKPSYLFGTMHLSDQRVFDFSDSVIAKIQECEGFALEVAPDSLNQFIAQVLLDKEEKEDTIQRDLKSDLSAKEYAILKEKLLAETSLNLDELKSKSPGQIANLLNSPTLGRNDKSTFLDGYLYRIALGEKKSMHGLEQISDNTYESSSKYEEGIEELKEIIYASEYKATADRLIQLYYEGDIEKINQFVSVRDTSDRYNLAQRNRNMAERIQDISAKHTVFYAVGAAHLAGDEGIIALLKRKGYTVTKVPSSFTGQAAKYKPKPIDVSWQRHSFPKEGYSISLPGKPILYPLKEKIPLTMYAYPDLATGIFYFSLSVKVPPSNANVKMEDVLEVFVNNMFKNKEAAKGFKKKSFVFKGTDAVESEFYNSKDQMYGRVRILKKNGFIYFVMLCSYKKEALKNQDSDLYFQSMEFVKPEVAEEKDEDPGFNYVSEEGAFSVNIKGKRKTFMKEVESGESIVNAYFLCGEESNDLAYFVVYYLPPAGLMVYDDSTYLTNIISKLTATTDPEVAQVKDMMFNGYPAKSCFKEDKKKELLMDIKLVLRGSRLYMIFVVGTEEKLKATASSTARFFDSFKFKPFKESKWFAYEDKEEGLKWIVPGEVQKQADTTYSVELPYEKAYSAIDSCSGISYVVNVSTYSPYYYMSSADFIKKQKEDYVGKGDSILFEKKHHVNGIPGIEWVIGMKDSHNQKRVFIRPLDNKLVQVYSCSAPDMIQSEATNKFFSSVAFSNPKAKTTLFESKAEKLLKDLSSEDSITYWTALGMLDYYEFQPSESKLLYAELKEKRKDDSSGYESIRSVLLTRLRDIEDASTVPFIKGLYPALNAYPYLQVKALETLLHLKSKASHELVTSIISESIPDVDELSYTFFESLNDSLELNQALFPEIFTLVKSEVYRNGIYSLANTLLDSNAIKKDFFLPHLEQLLAFCKEDGEVAQDYNAAYMNVWYAITLFGHFTDHQEALAYLNLMSHHADDLLAFEAVGELIKHKQTIDPNVLLHFAAQNKYRIRLYRLLKENDQLSLFPVKWNKQEYFAEADMYDYMGGYDDEYYYEKIQLINSKVINHKGVSSRFYLFKLLSEDEWYVGISGPYPLDKKQTYTEDTYATRSLYETLKSKSINAHYEDLLKEEEAEDEQ